MHRADPEDVYPDRQTTEHVLPDDVPSHLVALVSILVTDGSPEHEFAEHAADPPHSLEVSGFVQTALPDAVYPDAHAKDEHDWEYAVPKQDVLPDNPTMTGLLWHSFASHRPLVSHVASLLHRGFCPTLYPVAQDIEHRVFEMVPSQFTPDARLMIEGVPEHAHVTLDPPSQLGLPLVHPVNVLHALQFAFPPLQGSIRS